MGYFTSADNTHNCRIHYAHLIRLWRVVQGARHTYGGGQRERVAHDEDDDDYDDDGVVNSRTRYTARVYPCVYTRQGESKVRRTRGHVRYAEIYGVRKSSVGSRGR